MTSLIEKVHSAITASNSSRCLVYKEINPHFILHDIYKTKHVINEFQRISFTRFRICGHSLAVETGRWNRRGRGRLPVEERLCSCGQVQTERHVVEACPLTENIRQMYDITRLEDLFNDNISNHEACAVIHEILEIFK